MRLAAHLWTGGGQPPAEYVTLVLCRDVYHCPPSLLRRERLVDILAHLTCLGIEADVRKASRKTR